MKITGIIAEYNPFHNGHQYQIQQVKKETGSDYVIVAMSGDFVQRGAPAIADKYLRAKMALACGADLVLSLPALWSVSSAEYFARGGVSLLSSLGVVDYLCYGCETDQPELLASLSGILLEEPARYQKLLTEKLKSGFTFPLARSLALTEYTSQNLESILSSPNNILALEYEKAIQSLHSGLISHPVLRMGSGHHDSEGNHGFCSATALRNRFLQSEDSLSPVEDALETYIPAPAWPLLSNYFSQNPPLSEDDCSAMLYYKLLCERREGFSTYADCSLPLSNRICNRLEEFTSISEFTKLLHTKETTYSRLSRVLMHILLNMRQEDYGNLSSPAPYARVLGFRKDSTPLLHALKSHSSIPLITSIPDSIKDFSGFPRSLLDSDCFARDIFRSLLIQKGGGLTVNDYRHPPVIS